MKVPFTHKLVNPHLISCSVGSSQRAALPPLLERAGLQSQQWEQAGGPPWEENL